MLQTRPRAVGSRRTKFCELKAVSRVVSNIETGGSWGRIGSHTTGGPPQLRNPSSQTARKILSSYRLKVACFLSLCSWLKCPTATQKVGRAPAPPQPFSMLSLRLLGRGGARNLFSPLARLGGGWKAKPVFLFPRVLCTRNLFSPLDPRPLREAFYPLFVLYGFILRGKKGLYSRIGC